MQSLGFAYAIEPVLKRLYPDREEFRSRLNLHMEYFNTQPYLAAFVLGAVARVEEDRAFGRSSTVDVTDLKTSLMAPLGALGDSFFWGALKPFAAVIAVSVLVAGTWWAPWLFLVLYNVWHLTLRAAAFIWGYESSGDVLALVAHYRFTRMARWFKAVTLAVLGGMLGMMPSWLPEFKLPIPAPEIGIVLAGLSITLMLVVVLRKGGSPVKLMLGLAVICLALAYAGIGK